MAHTPGPWHFRPVINADRAVAALLLETKHEPMPHNDPGIMAVREDWTGYLFRTPQGQANARLIAAAPDLLYCLDELLKHIEWRRRVAGEETGPNDCTHRARAAIAKAEGRE